MEGQSAICPIGSPAPSLWPVCIVLSKDKEQNKKEKYNHTTGFRTPV